MTTSWKDKMRARLAARAERSTPTTAVERSAEAPAVEGRKVPVAGPPPKAKAKEKKARALSTKGAARVLNLASVAGVFGDLNPQYWEAIREEIVEAGGES